MRNTWTYDIQSKKLHGFHMHWPSAWFGNAWGAKTCEFPPFSEQRSDRPGPKNSFANDAIFGQQICVARLEDNKKVSNNKNTYFRIANGQMNIKWIKWFGGMTMDDLQKFRLGLWWSVFRMVSAASHESRWPRGTYVNSYVLLSSDVTS